MLADTYSRTFYADQCDYVRFRADYLVLAAPLGEAWERLSAEVPDKWFPGYARVMQRLFPPTAPTSSWPSASTTSCRPAAMPSARGLELAHA